MQNERACANTPDLSRRNFMTLAPIAVIVTPSIGVCMTPAASHASAEIPAAHVHRMETPFLSWVNYQGDGQEVLALCYPLDRIVHAFCYVLTDGRTIFAEGKRVNDGSGWRLQEPGEYDGRVIGRVVSIHLQHGKSWTQAGSGWLCG